MMFFVAFSIAAWKPILILASFGCYQMAVCNGKKGEDLVTDH